jgi:hypothetical protein
MTSFSWLAIIQVSDRRSVGQSILVSSTLLGSETRILLLSDCCGFFLCGAPSLTRGRMCRLQLLLVLASAVIVVFKSRGTHDCIFLSQIRESPQPGGRGPLIYIPRERSGPVIVQVRVTLRRAVYRHSVLGNVPLDAPGHHFYIRIYIYIYISGYIYIYIYIRMGGRGMHIGYCWWPCRSSAVRRWLPTAAARVRVRAACGVCGRQRGTGAGFLRVLRFPLPIIPPILHYLNHPGLTQ